MGLFGKLLSLPIKIVNTPLKVAEDVLEEVTGGKDSLSEDRRLLSKPLDYLAEHIEEIDD
jgi:hypothetical protein